MGQPLKYVGPANSILVPGIGNKVYGVRSNSADPLFHWRRYYSKRGHRPVNVLMVGDSITWGQGAAVGSPPNYDNWTRTIPFQVQQLLNERGSAVYHGQGNQFGTAGAYSPSTVAGGYFLRAMHVLGGTPSPWKVVAGTQTQVNRGMGATSLQLDATSRISFTAPSSSGFNLIYEDGASNLGTPAISIYAGDQASTRTGQYVDNFAATMNTGLAQYTRSQLPVALPSRGKYTVEISRSTGTPVVDGVYVYDMDLRHGVRVYNWAWTGTSAFDWTTNSTQWNTAAASIASIPDPGVDMIVYYIGAADYSVQNGTSTPAMFTTNLQGMIDKYRAIQSRTIPVLLVSHFARYDITPSTYAWSLFEDAMKAAAASRVECDYLKLSPYFPTSQAADTDEDLVDSSGVHFTEQGMGVAAQAIAQKLMSPWAWAA
jgi:lysophospholipase L1-like esterase